jgi:hypothetical protein
MIILKKINWLFKQYVLFYLIVVISRVRFNHAVLKILWYEDLSIKILFS